jgi:polar amino acid transport system substrate-binding protein
MKQVVQHLNSGAVGVEEVPAPALRGPGVLVATACSLISPGTERATIELGRSSLLGKALRRPDQVRRVLDNLRREGLAQTWNKVQARLETTRPLGYSCAGIVLESRECELAPGTRVACAGTDAATHAEVNFVPRNLCATIPEGVGFEEAAFVALGAIALHAVHLAQPGIGEEAAVIGLGPVGLLLAQILRASGCRVAGFDLREDRLEMARGLGFERVAPAERTALGEQLRAWKLAEGFDHVFIAAASRSAEPVEWAVEAAGDRAKLIVVGDVRTDLNRAECYRKELTVIYARSYGPGRYDAAYESGGEDYPRSQVRWSVRRNLEAFLELLGSGQVRAAPLITHRFPIEQAERAYEVIGGAETSLGVLLTYPLGESRAARSMELKPVPAAKDGRVRVGFLGAGNYAQAYLLPALKADARAQLVAVATERGISAKQAAEKYGFARCSTEAEAVIRDQEVDVVFIATRHDSHARLALQAIEAGKAVFVEKPLALREDELEAIVAAHARHPVPLMVGHNRRWAPATRALIEFFGRVDREGRRVAGAAPLNLRYTVRAGPLPREHWLRDPAQGGRILGEVCHFVDWCLYVVGAPLEKLFATAQGALPDEGVHAVLRFADGSVATIVYDTEAHPSLPKEVIEAASGGRSATVENFAGATFVTLQGRRTVRFAGKGQREMIAAWLDGCAEQKPLPEFGSWEASARATLKLAESATSGLPAWFGAGTGE